MFLLLSFLVLDLPSKGYLNLQWLDLNLFLYALAQRLGPPPWCPLRDHGLVMFLDQGKGKEKHQVEGVIDAVCWKQTLGRLDYLLRQMITEKY